MASIAATAIDGTKEPNEPTPSPGKELMPLPGDLSMQEEIRIGFEKLRTMSPDELRQVIRERVDLLETVLREREQRRAALETARLASRILDYRRERSRRLHRHVNLGSTLAAALTTLLIVYVAL